jgi:lipopolysaccharide transport system ATP-binding protein
VPNGESDEDFWALKDVSFDVEAGEVVGIIGRNGAGKSTLLKILSRITPPTSGRVTIDGRVGSLLEVGTGFHPELTGRENIFMNGSILGMSRREIERKFDEIVDFSGVEKFLDTPVKRYSSGMHVRLAFAVAAHLEPEVLLVDEVLAVGDAEFQKRCLGKMQNIASGGRTVLFVSHSMVAVQSLCQSAVLLSSGSVESTGPAAAVIAEYIKGAGRSVAAVDLSSRNSVFRQVRLCDAAGNPAASFRTGDDLYVSMEVDVPGRAAPPVLGINITSASGLRVATVSTAFELAAIPAFSGRAHVQCVIPRIPFVQGQYSVRLGLDNGATNPARLEDAIMFDVLPTDRSGRGFVPTPAHGCVDIESTWEVTPC